MQNSHKLSCKLLHKLSYKHSHKLESDLCKNKSVHEPITHIHQPIVRKYYADMSERVGCFPGQPYYIQVDPNIPPKQTLMDGFTSNLYIKLHCR